MRICARIIRLDNGIAVLLTGGESSHMGAAACGIHRLERVLLACNRSLERTALFQERNEFFEL